MTMLPADCRDAERSDKPSPVTSLEKILRSLSVITMLMTIPQVWTIWVGHQAAGVSVLSWSAYLASAVLWLWHGLHQRDCEHESGGHPRRL